MSKYTFKTLRANILTILITLLLCVGTAYADIPPYIDVNFTDFGTVRLGFNTSLYSSNSIIVYGTPEDVLKYLPNLTNPQAYVNGQWRYYGFRSDGTPYTNPSFPPDAGGGSNDYATRSYVSNPWNEVYPGTNEPLCDSNDPSYVAILTQNWSFIQNQLASYGFPNYMLSVDSLNTYWSIQSYPLPGEIYGTLREWHWRNGWPWYETYQVKFRPYPDFAVTKLEVEENTVSPGQTYHILCYIDELDPTYTLTSGVNFTAEASGLSYPFFQNIYPLPYSGGNPKTVEVARTFPSGASQDVITVKINGGQTGQHDFDENGRYSNNQMTITINANSPIIPPPPSGGGGGTASNLVADSVTYDKNQQIATAKFHSTFPVGGNVTARFYSNSMAGGTSITQVGDPQVMHIDANGSIQVTDLFFISDGATLYATIDLTYDGTNWNSSKFASSTGAQDETTYEDNKTTCVIGNPPVTPPPQPAANDEIHPASYHPVVQTPHYHDETYQEWVPNWVSVPYIRDESKPKIRVYLSH